MALTAEQIRAKIKDGTATFGEVLDFAYDYTDTENSKRQILNVKSTGVKQMGLTLDTPWSEYTKKEVYSKMYPSENHPKVKANRYTHFAAVEKALVGAFGESQEAYPLTKITGAGGLAKTQGLGGQARDSLEMRGLLNNKRWNAVYDTAFKSGKITSQDHKDALLFHKITGGRPSQIFPKDEKGKRLYPLTVDDFVFQMDPDTNLEYITMTSSRNVNKGRAAIEFRGEEKLWIEGIIERAKAKDSKSLFDISNKDYAELFRQRITPLLKADEKIMQLLPVKKDGTIVTTASSVRSVTNKILLDEFRIPESYVDAYMGHIPQSMVRGRYAGQAPAEIMGEVLEAFVLDSAYQSGSNNTREWYSQYGVQLPDTVEVDGEQVEVETRDALDTGYRYNQTDINKANQTRPLTENERKLIDEKAQAGIEVAKKTKQEARVETLQKQIEEMKTVTSPEYQALKEEYDTLTEQQAETDRKNREARAEQKKEEKKLKPDERKAISQGFRNLFTSGGAKAVAGLGVAGLGIGASLVSRVSEAQEKIEAGKPVIPSVLEEAGQFVLEEGPVGMVEGALDIGTAAVGAVLEPAVEEYEEQAEEAGLEEDQTGQMYRLFGVPPRL